MRFHVWSYAHLPLYLGIAVTGVGLEHVITTATATPLHAPEAWILAGAVTALMLALTAISTTSHRHTRGTRATRHRRAWLLSLAPLALGAAGTSVMPAVVVAGFLGLSLAQLWLALADRHARLKLGA